MTDEMQGDPKRPLMTSRRIRRRPASAPLFLVVFFVIATLSIGAVWVWQRSRSEPEEAPSVHVDSVAPTPAQPFVLPSLGASDAAVRALVSGVSSHPRLASWLVTDDLVRRFVEAVVDISRGSSPAVPLDVLIPEEPFSVQATGDRLVTAPRSHQRYDLLGEVFAGVDAQAAAETYRRLLPLFREAYQELGVQDGEFEEVLGRAIGALLAVDVPEGPLELREAVGRYVYLDPSIESLTPAQKHMFRLGPVNAGLVQEKLREISVLLDLPL